MAVVLRLFEDLDRVVTRWAQPRAMRSARDSPVTRITRSIELCLR